MVVVVQLVRTPDCGSGGRRFESGLPPKSKPSRYRGFFCCSNYWMSSDIIKEYMAGCPVMELNLENSNVKKASIQGQKEKVKLKM